MVATAKRVLENVPRPPVGNVLVNKLAGRQITSKVRRKKKLMEWRPF